jgi:hypothetical protein
MSAYSSAVASGSRAFSEFRVEKARIEATLTLSSGAAVRGCFFVAGSSRTHPGPERIKDVLNGESGFFPFEVAGNTGTATVLYNREHLVMAKLADRSEARTDPGYDIATVRTITVLLSNGTRLRGTVRVYQPQGRDRLSDFARGAETFRYLEAEGDTYLFNVRHVLELAEETS